MGVGAPPTPHWPWEPPSTHQKAEVWPVEPGGGETQGHVRADLSHLGWREEAAAVTTAALQAAGCPCVRATPTPGQEMGGKGQANVPPSSGFA